MLNSLNSGAVFQGGIGCKALILRPIPLEAIEEFRPSTRFRSAG